MSSFDHYAATRDLIANLEHAGCSNEAAVLRNAIAEGSTGTEIFMAIRFHIAEIISRVPLAPDIGESASRLLAELDKALE